MDKGTYEQLTARLGKLSRHILLVQIAGAALYALAAALVISLVLAFFESFAYASPPVKIILFHLLWLLPSVLFITLVIVYLVRRPGPDETARLVERAFPALNDRLISAVQLGRLPSSPAGQSSELIDALIEYANRETLALDLRRAVPLGQLIASFHAVAAGVILFLGFTVAFPDRVTGGLYRLIDHQRVYQPLNAKGIYTVHQIQRIIKGEDFTVFGFVTGTDVKDVSIWFRWGADRNWNTKPVLESRQPGDFSVTIENPRASFEYYLESPGASTSISAVEVIERPSIASLASTLTYPVYTGLGTVQKNDGDGNIRALAGTAVTMSVKANKPLSRMTLVWSDSTSMFCAVSGNTGTVAFDLKKNVDYHFDLVDTLGIANENPIMYSVTCLTDEFPTIKLLSPAADVVLPGSMQIPLVYRAADDFGISRLELLYQVPFEKQQRTVPLSRPSEASVTAQYDWNLTALNLLPEDTVTYSLVVYDNDLVNGPKKAETEPRKIRLPSITDIFADTKTSQDADIQKLLDISQRASEQQQKLEDVSKALKSGEQMDWSGKNSLEEMQKNLEQMQKDFQDVSKNLEGMAEKLSNEDISTVETLQKLQQISAIMDDIADGEMKEAIRQLTQVSAETDPQRMNQVLGENQVTTEEIQKKLDRIISLLKQAKTIQEFEMAKNILADLALKQALLGQKYEIAPKDTSLTREEKALVQEMKKTQDMLSAAVDSIRSQFKIDTSAAEKSLEKNDASKTMSQAAGQMEKQETENAESSHDDADKQISDLLTDMDSLDARMKNSNTAEIKRRLFAALNQLIIISDEEEALGDSMVNGEPSEMAQEQLSIIEGFQKAEGSLSRLGELVMEIIPVIEQVTENSRQMMTSTMDALSKGDTAQGGRLADQTLQTLNTSINFLTQLLQKSEGAQGSSGLSGDLMQQLQQIANGQLNLQQQLSQEQMSQLAAEQQKLAQMLSELNQKIQNDSQLRNMLEKLSEEMDDTADRMKRNEPRELVERQQGDIYRRLLDARRSQREQENSMERKSSTARENVSIGSETLVQGLGEQEQELNRRLDEAIKGDFDPAYKQIIRSYFESLLRDQGALGK